MRIVWVIRSFFILQLIAASSFSAAPEAKYGPFLTTKSPGVQNGKLGEVEIAEINQMVEDIDTAECVGGKYYRQQLLQKMHENPNWQPSVYETIAGKATYRFLAERLKSRKEKIKARVSKLTTEEAKTQKVKDYVESLRAGYLSKDSFLCAESERVQAIEIDIANATVRPLGIVVSQVKKDFDEKQARNKELEKRFPSVPKGYISNHACGLPSGQVGALRPESHGSR